MPPELITSDLSLSPVLIDLFHRLYGYERGFLLAIRVRSDARNTVNAEAWSSTDIRINPQAHIDKEDMEASWWLSTLSHEIHHCYQFFKSRLPAFLNRFINSIDRKMKGHDNARWEKEAMARGMETLAFCIAKESELKKLLNPELSAQKQKQMINDMVLDYKVLLTKRTSWPRETGTV